MCYKLMKKIIKQFQDNEVTIASDNPKFLKFVEGYLKNFFNEASEKKNKKINVTFHWKDIFYEKLHNKIGKNVSMNGNKIYYKQNHYHLVAEMNEGMNINIYPRYTSFKNMVKEIIKNAGIDAEYHFYQTLLRNGFHFPLFYNLGKDNFQFYHGSACKVGKNILIMPGAAGIGKTIANMCFQLIYPEASSISDNYLLYKKDTIYAFPEPLRFPTLFNNSIPIDFEPVFRIKDREYYLKKNMTSQSFSLKDHNVYFLFIVRSRKETLQKINSHKSIKILQSTTDYVSHEFHGNSWIAFLPYIDGDLNKKCSDRSLLVANSSTSFLCKVPTFNTIDDAVGTYRRIIGHVLDEDQ